MTAIEISVQGVGGLLAPTPPDKCRSTTTRQRQRQRQKRSNRESYFGHVTVINPFYEKCAASIHDPSSSYRLLPTKKSERLGFLSSDARFYSRPTESPGPADYQEDFLCWKLNPRCPNGYGSMRSLSERFLDLCKVEPTPGPADYSLHPNAFKKSLSFSKSASTIHPVLYGNESCSSDETPGPNHYNVSHHPVTHCCNWRTHRSVFAPRFVQCPRASDRQSVGPTDYNVNDSLTKPSLRQPVAASFQSGVPTLYSLIKLTSLSTQTGPGWYDIGELRCHPPSAVRPPKNSLLGFTPSRKASRSESRPGPGSYNLAGKPKLYGRPVPTAAFAPPSWGSHKEPEKSPGPADYFPLLRKKCHYRR